jgi:hypothetical protein
MPCQPDELKQKLEEVHDLLHEVMDLAGCNDPEDIEDFNEEQVAADDESEAGCSTK